MNNDLIEIDLSLLLKKIWSKKIIIITVALCFAMIAALYSTFLIKATYKTSTNFYTVNRTDANKTITTAELQLASNLMRDYTEIILTPSVLEETIKLLDLKMSVGELKSKIEISSPANTRIVVISVTDTDPIRGAKIANTHRDVSISKIKEITKINDVTTLTEASAAINPFAPKIYFNIAIGFLAGLILSIILVIIKELLDDRVKIPEDIEDVMGLTLLGVIPDSKKGSKV